MIKKLIAKRVLKELRKKMIKWKKGKIMLNQVAVNRIEMKLINLKKKTIMNEIENPWRFIYIKTFVLVC